MRMLLCTCATVMLAAWTVQAVPKPVPWSESFEDYTNGAVLAGSGWTTQADADLQAYILTTNISYHGTNVAYVPVEGFAAVAIDGAAEDRVWVDMFAKITLRDSAPDVDASMSSMFYFNEGGYPVVYDGVSSRWLAIGTNMSGQAVTPVVDAAWTRVTVVHNYGSKNWVLLVAGEVVKDRIGFINGGITQMGGMVVSNQVYFDSIVITNGPPDGTVFSGNAALTADSDADGLPDWWELMYFGSVSTQRGSDDSDGDGRSNASEYAADTDPTDPTSPGPASVAIPYRDGFESATNGAVSTVEWRGINVYGDASVTGSAYIEGRKAVGVYTGAVHVVVAGTNDATNVWVQIYAKPHPYEEVPAASAIANNQVVGFCVLTNGNLMAFSGAAWVNTDVVPKVPTNAWLGFALHLDYIGSNYNLYVSTNGVYGDIMRRAHTGSLAFNTNASAVTKMTRLVVTNEGSMYFDAIAISHAYTNTGTSLTNLLAYDRIAGATTEAQMPPYNYEAGSNLLSGEVGWDLARGLAASDKLHVYSNGWHIYELDASFDWQHESGAQIADLELKRAMGMQIQRVGMGVDTVVFYPYSNMVALTQNVYIFGTNDLASAGWNLLTSPFAEVRYPNDLTYNYGFPGAALGDKIYMSGRRIFWNGSKWKDGSADSSLPLAPGAVFWYYHTGSGIFWQVSP